MNKAELRKFYKEKRNQLDEKLFESLNRKIIEIFLAKFDISKFKHISSYLNIKKLKEFDSQRLIKEIQHKYPEVIFGIPKISTDKTEIVNYKLEADTIFETNSLGISEPRSGLIIEPKVFDMVIVPLLAFDNDLHRVGYGGGFYDKFLANCRPDCHKLGISFFDPIRMIEDVQTTDVALNAVITPDRIYRLI